MSKYAHLKFDNSSPLTKLTLQIDDEDIKISGRAGKWFTNIPIEGKNNIRLIGNNNDNCELICNDEKMFHPDQIGFDSKYHIRKHLLEDEATYYSLSGNIENPSKILITFPGVSNFDNVNYRLSAMTSLQERLEGTLILAFQDKEGVYGNYMHETNNGYPIKAIAASLIFGIMEKYCLTGKDLIFYGNSKGGSIAISYISSFPDSYFFIDIPQMELFNYDAQNDLMRFSLGKKTRLHYNFVEKLPLLKNNKVTYSFAENDFDNSRGLPMKKFPDINMAMLKDMEHSGAAMELVKRQFSKVIQLISEKSAIVRPEISASWETSFDKLYFKRMLGSFNNETDIKNIYAEIEFVNQSSNYCVSLNKKFHKKIQVHWENGFDVKKHLPNGIYSMILHVYSNYKEFIYPLDKRLNVESDTFTLFDSKNVVVTN